MANYWVQPTADPHLCEAGESICKIPVTRGSSPLNYVGDDTIIILLCSYIVCSTNVGKAPRISDPTSCGTGLHSGSFSVPHT